MITVLKIFRLDENSSKNFLIGLGITFVLILFISMNIRGITANPWTEVTVNGASGVGGAGGTGGIGDTGGTGGIRGTGGSGGFNGTGGRWPWRAWS